MQKRSDGTGLPGCPDSAAHYNAHAHALADAYERIDPAVIHQIWLPCLPWSPADILDVGAGSGRDAAWLAGMGHRVIAVEPADALIREARRRHSETRIEWLSDALPDLCAVRKRAGRFDLILASAVWMHVIPADRSRCLNTFSEILLTGGHLIITLRHGPSPDGRVMHPDSESNIVDLAHPYGLRPVAAVHPATSDQLGREAVRWQTLILRKGHH